MNTTWDETIPVQYSFEYALAKGDPCTIFIWIPLRHCPSQQRTCVNTMPMNTISHKAYLYEYGAATIDIHEVPNELLHPYNRFPLPYANAYDSKKKTSAYSIHVRFSCTSIFAVTYSYEYAINPMHVVTR